MQTKLEKQANQLWEDFGEGSAKFWQKYEQLIKVARKENQIALKRPQKKPPVLDLLTAYALLPKTYYHNLSSKEPLYAVITGRMLAALLASFILWIAWITMSWFGTLIVFAVLLAIAYAIYNVWPHDELIALDIQPDYMLFGTKDDQKKVEHKYIIDFEKSITSFSFTAYYPQLAIEKNPRRMYTIPLMKVGKTGHKPLSKTEREAIFQFLIAIIRENKLKKKTKK
ncbi:hypothetical protein BKI52_45090 [marine bacterium AO1-C]|nr:hypothetical protein BKI52_45090 [marine bacterium AO1-C]